MTKRAEKRRHAKKRVCPSKSVRNDKSNTSLKKAIEKDRNQVENSQSIPGAPPPSKKYKILKNISAEKLKNSKIDNIDSSKKKLHRTRSTTKKLGLHKSMSIKQCTGNKIINMDIVNQMILSLCENKTIQCPTPTCKSESKISFYESQKKKFGLAEHLMLICKNCKSTIKSFNTSKRETSKTRSFEINTKSVLASLSIGQEGLKKFCANLDLPAPVTSKPYNNILKLLNEHATEQAEMIMKEAAAERLKNILKKEELDKISFDEKGNEIADVAVSVDGTWQKRGHSSKIGVVFAISVRTGEVLDYVVKSMFCNTCSKHKNDDKSSSEYLAWFDLHIKACSVNHTGSSDSMETEDACEIFLRSIEKHGLKYGQFVGDGDTGTFGKVRDRCKEAFGDEYGVVKEECVGHVQKRMGSGLRELKRKRRGEKLLDGKMVGGKGRLTDKLIDKLQNYYGEAIRNNTGDKASMENDIWAIYKHTIRDDLQTLDQQHSYCPKNTWCKFWADQSKYDDEKRLPSCFLNILKPIFLNLTKSELLSRCLKGLTQNQNEAINGILWSKCPKTKFCGLTKVQLATAQTVCQFNTGAASQVTLEFNKCSSIQ